MAQQWTAAPGEQVDLSVVAFVPKGRPRQGEEVPGSYANAFRVRAGTEGAAARLGQRVAKAATRIPEGAERTIVVQAEESLGEWRCEQEVKMRVAAIHTWIRPESELHRAQTVRARAITRALSPSSSPKRMHIGSLVDLELQSERRCASGVVGQGTLPPIAEWACMQAAEGDIIQVQTADAGPETIVDHMVKVVKVRPNDGGLMRSAHSALSWARIGALKEAAHLFALTKEGFRGISASQFLTNAAREAECRIRDGEPRRARAIAEEDKAACARFASGHTSAFERLALAIAEAALESGDVARAHQVAEGIVEHTARARRLRARVAKSQSRLKSGLVQGLQRISPQTMSRRNRPESLEANGTVEEAEREMEDEELDERVRNAIKRSDATCAAFGIANPWDPDGSRADHDACRALMADLEQ